MSAVWNSLIEALGGILVFFHNVTEPLFGVFAWGWAIILLTFAVRLILVPLAVKQTNSMRASQRLQPELKKIQTKYKVDRDLMRSNPQKYRERRQKQQEAQMALYKEHGVNPAASCLPLIAQMPIFIALFSVLRSETAVPELQNAPFYLIERLSLTPAAGLQAGLGVFGLMLLMGLTTFYSQKQMMASNPGPQLPQQQALLYAMPVILTFFSLNLPVGVLLYWVATNVWTIGQQWVMFRNIERAPVKA